MSRTTGRLSNGHAVPSSERGARYSTNDPTGGTTNNASNRRSGYSLGKALSKFRLVQFEEDLGRGDIPGPFGEATPESRRRSSAGGGSNSRREPEILPVPEPQGGRSGSSRNFAEEEEDNYFLNMPAPVYSSGTWLGTGRWYTRQDVVMLYRSEPSPIILSVDTSLAALPTLSNNANSFDYTPGGRITIGRILGRDRGNRDQFIEGTFFGAFDWDTHASLTTPTAGSITTVLGPGGGGTDGFQNADTQSFVYEATYDQIDINFGIMDRPARDRMVMQPDGSWLRHMAPSKVYTWYGGMRLLFINEGFYFDSTGATESGNYSVRTINDMFGLQFGGRLVEQYSQWSWGGSWEVGGLVNFVDRKSRVDTTTNGVVAGRGEYLHNETLVFAGKGGILATYQIRPNMSLRASYDFVYLTGLALAAENVSLADPAGFGPLKLTGQTLYHGAHVGFEMFW